MTATLATGAPAEHRPTPPWAMDLDAVILTYEPAGDAPVWVWRYITADAHLLATGWHRDRWEAIEAACRVVGVDAGVLAATITTEGTITRRTTRHGRYARSVTMIDTTRPRASYRKAPRR